MENQTHLIIIGGSIGAGKSTLVKLIEAHLNDTNVDLVAFPEQVEQWKHLLERVYQQKNPQKVGRDLYLLQSKIIQIFTDILIKIEEMIIARKKRETSRHLVIVMERSVLDARDVFTKNSKDLFSKDEYQLLYNMASKHIQFFQHIYKNATYVYLQTTPQLCMERIQTRKRISEDQIQLSYLENLHKEYENMAPQIQRSLNMKVILIPCGPDKSPSQILEELCFEIPILRLVG